MIVDAPSNEWHNVIGDFLPDHPKSSGYVTVRNPYDRAVSMYVNIVCGPRHPAVYSHIREIMGDQPITFLNFCYYLRTLADNNWADANCHFLPQTYTASTTITPNCFSNGRLHLIKCDPHEHETPDESLKRQYKNVYRILTSSNDFDSKVDAFFTDDRIKNITERSNSFEGDLTNIDMTGWEVFPLIHCFLTPETKTLIREIYANDFELLGYHE